MTGGANGGFLRQVLGVQQHGGATQLLTAPASLAEAVDRGLLVKNIEFTTEDLQQTGLLSREGDIRILRLRDIQLYRDHGAVVRISEAGLFCLPEVYIGALYQDHILTAFRAEASGTLQLSIDFEVAVDEDRPVTFYTDLLPAVRKPFVTHVGFLPVFGVAELRFMAGMEGRFDGDTRLTAGFEVNAPFEVGMAYAEGFLEDNRGFGPLRLEGHPPQWVVDVGADLRFFVTVDIGVTLYDSAEFDFVATPYLNTNVHATPPPQTLTVTGGLEVDTHYGLHILDWRLRDESWSFELGPRELHYWSSAGY